MSALTENARQSLRHLSIDLETYSSVSIQKNEERGNSIQPMASYVRRKGG